VPQLVDDLRARAITVGSLINCAGFGTFGTFVDADAQREMDQIAVNVGALTALTHAFLPDLLKTAISHPHGAALVNVASTAAFQPVPRMAVYGATKAYVVSFTQAIWYETRHTGLKVTTVCPGAVDTEFFQVAQNHDAAFGRFLTVDEVMATTFSALDRVTTPLHSISGIQNAVLARLAALAPRRAVVTVTGRMSAPGRTH
jgi:short-subunit dehydrogenase